ncbi:MAG TPA: hypothetical protein VII52_03840 [Gemmatimonadaceae bacterium]
MTLDDARSAWQSRAQVPGCGMAGDDLLELARQRSRAFDAKIRKRDLREVGSMLVAVPLVAPLLLQPSWITRVGAALVLLSCTFIYWKLRRARRTGSDAGAGSPLTDVLRAERAALDAQIRLSDSVLRWYVAPLAAGMVLTVAGDWGAAWLTLTFVIIVVLLAWRIVSMSRRAVDLRLRPMRDELTRLLDQAAS